MFRRSGDGRVTPRIAVGLLGQAENETDLFRGVLTVFDSMIRGHGRAPTVNHR